MVPEELKYTDQHEWVASRNGGSVRIGITDYAQQQLGDVVFVELPEVGIEVDAGGAVGEVESTKSVSEIFAPVAGTVTAVNSVLNGQPELVNSDPYGDGWMIELALPDAGVLDELMDAAAYRALTDSQ